MIETRVPKDIRVYKTKVIGNFTLRQVICIVLCFVIDFAAYKFIIKPLHAPIEAIIYVAIFLDVPILAFSQEKMGMKMEDYLKSVFHDNFLSIKTRRPECMLIEEKNEKRLTSKEKKKLNKEREAYGKKHPDLKAYD